MTLTSKNDVHDYIGSESCIDLQNENDVVDHFKSNDVPKRSYIKKKEKREFPPPMPRLAQTQNLASHMPWVYKRYYTDEGRLIIKEERVKHHEYFHVHRADGRLTMHLVPLDHEIEEDYYSDTSEEEYFTPLGTHDDDDDDDEEIDNDTSVDEEQKASNDGGAVDGFSLENDEGLPLNCNSVRSSPSCSFAMPVPLHPIRTVRG